jgi:hypothetical protein
MVQPGVSDIVKDPKAYLEYLDKEMASMGILPAFSVALASLPLTRTSARRRASSGMSG